MNIAILTPEYITEYPDGGGLGNFLARFTRLLINNGHSVTVFVYSEKTPLIYSDTGIKVVRVSRKGKPLWMRLIGVIARMIHPGGDFFRAYFIAANAWLLANAMEQHHKLQPFDMVHSADYLSVGLFVKYCKNRIHLIRCSHAVDLYKQIDGRNSFTDQLIIWLEIKALKKAKGCYSPSQYVADHYTKTLGLPVHVIRPPIPDQAKDRSNFIPPGLPDRFFIHFGQLCERKGTQWMFSALKLAFELEPDIRIVMIGKGNFRQVGDWLSDLGSHRSKVLALYPLTKNELYSVLQKADAAILPSLVDNLPNTVIESLSLGVPVIGTQGASIDELVEDGASGILIESGNIKALSDAIVKTWRNEISFSADLIQHSSCFEMMKPDVVMHQLMEYISSLQETNDVKGYFWEKWL